MKIEQMFCSTCGKDLTANATFCPQCGEWITENPDTNKANVTPPPVTSNAESEKSATFASGSYLYNDLPTPVQKRIVQRLSRKREDKDSQYICGDDDIPSLIFYSIVSGGSAVFSFYVACRHIMVNYDVVVLSGIWGLLSTYVFITFLFRTIKQIRCPIGAYFILTPLYFVETQFDRVWVKPILYFKSITGTSTHRVGTFESKNPFNFQYSDVVIEFEDGEKRSFRFGRWNDYGNVSAKLDEFTKKIVEAVEQENYEYFVENDDFRELHS
ncbi:MAG: zinc ribbon domain-containing protein [Planctomycetaceae bacterium]|nr:zinc ribbon domain-containing protein [Planctomycetaceae bacterium]